MYGEKYSSLPAAAEDAPLGVDEAPIYSLIPTTSEDFPPEPIEAPSIAKDVPPSSAGNSQRKRAATDAPSKLFKPMNSEDRPTFQAGDGSRTRFQTEAAPRVKRDRHGSMAFGKTMTIKEMVANPTEFRERVTTEWEWFGSDIISTMGRGIIDPQRPRFHTSANRIHLESVCEDYDVDTFRIAPTTNDSGLLKLPGVAKPLDISLDATGREVSDKSEPRSDSGIASDEVQGLSKPSAIFLLVTAIVGCGVVALPSLMKLGGWVIVPVMACATSLAFVEIASIMHNSISWCEDRRITHQDIASFEEFGRRAYGNTGAMAVRSITTTGFFGTLVVYTILISQNLYAFVNGACSRAVILVIACFIMRPKVEVFVTPLLLSLGMLRDLQAMAKIMPLGVFASLSSCALICVKAWLDADIIQDHAQETIELHTMWPDEFSSLGTIMAVLFSAYSVMGTVPSIRGQMQDRKDFLSAFRLAISVVFVVYLMVMSIGYYGYGNYVEDNVVASMLHPHLAQHRALERHTSSDEDDSRKRSKKSWSLLGTLMTLLVSTYLFIGFALFFACIVGTIQKLELPYGLSEPMSLSNRAMRCCIVFLVSGIGLFIPHFREVMAIMSSICCSCNNVFFPLLFSRKLELELPDSESHLRTSSTRRIAHVLILLLAVFCASLGLKDSVSKLHHEMSASGT